MNELLQKNLKLRPATKHDYLIIQNMARFYVYDLSRQCGFISKDWACPADGLYESFDFKIYFEDPTRKAFLITISNELAGFVLLNHEGFYKNTIWNMGEFFILAKFQNKGIGQLVATEIWKMHPGLWEVSVIPENQKGLTFWRKAISNFADGNYQEAINTVNYDPYQPRRVVFCFNSLRHGVNNKLDNKKEYQIKFVDKIDDLTEKRMTKDLVAYETRHGINVNYRSFSVTISNQEGDVFGVINAFTAFSEIYIDDIWVDSAYRGQGYGKRLLLALENHFKGQGFNNINLVTSAFQAPRIL